MSVSGDKQRMESSTEGAKGGSSTTPSEEGKNKGNRRGKGSKTRQAEKFREKKNQEWDKNFLANIEQKKIELGYKSEDLFGKRTVGQLTSPALQIPIDTDNILDLCDYSSEVLHTACKIPPSPNVPQDEDAIEYDADTLRWVSALQLEAKMWYARSGTEYLPDMSREVRATVKDTAQLLGEALLPLSVFIDQVGRFTLESQLFVPNYNGIRDVGFHRLQDVTNQSRMNFRDLVEAVIPPGVPSGLRDANGHMLYVSVVGEQSLPVLRDRGIVEADDPVRFTAAFLAEPMNFDFHDVLRFSPLVPAVQPPDFNTVLTRFSELKGRVNKKVRNAFAMVDILKGEGLPSQLVYQRAAGRNHEVWCPRDVPMDSIEIGAVLGLGFNNVLSELGVAKIMTIVNTAGALQDLANVLTKHVK